jgi:glycosyltransferase involved in cell wall biosynthesis
MTAMKIKPRLNLDVGPLFETRWTGLSVFTQRLANALLRSGELEVDFVHGLARLPAPVVMDALRAGQGAYLLDALDPERTPALGPVELDIPVLYPTSKGAMSGLAMREASVIHDLTTLFMPETHDAGNVALHLDNFGEALATDEAVFCISETTRAALLMAAPSTSSRTRLLPQYVEWPEHFGLANRNLPRAPLPPFALVIGTIEPRKNLQLLLNALQRLDSGSLPLHFVIVGRQGWRVEALLAEVSPRQQERLVFTGYISEFAKYRLLAQAEFLIFPSLCEGFGIPALEAMSLGKPVLASRGGSLPEVAADAAVYFDPLSVEEFLFALREIADPRRNAELGRRALLRAGEFTPRRMAAPVVDWVKS